MTLIVCLISLQGARLVAADTETESESTSEAQEELPQKERDLVVLTNGQEIEGRLRELPDEGAESIILVVPDGEVELSAKLVRAVRPSLDHRLENLKPDDAKGHMELARYCMLAERDEDALRLLRILHARKELSNRHLYLLAMLTDKSGSHTDALALYRLYKQKGGTNSQALERLALMEKIEAVYNKKRQEALEKTDSLPPIKDGEEANRKWKSENTRWSNSTKTQLISQGSGKRTNKVLQVDVSSGEKDKAIIVLRDRFDLSMKNQLTFYVHNPDMKKLRVSIAVKSRGDTRPVYYESRANTLVKNDDWKMVNFDLTTQTFKSEASKWAHKVGIENLKDISEVQIQFWNGKRSGTVLLDGIGFAALASDGM